MRMLSIKPHVPELRDYRNPKTHGKICVFDCETDPFEAGASIQPFTCGFYDGDDYVDFWGDDCIDQFGMYMERRKGERLLVYAHNLGGFDVHFLNDYFDDDTQPLIIGARIAKIQMFGQEWRDSLKIIPAPLRDFQKDDFDYMKNKRAVRDQYRAEIELYQRHDCEYLYTLVSEFHATFGNRITIGSTAINLLESFHGFDRLTQIQDENIRSFYFGGRNQCLETGVLDDDWKVYDVNSMYPYVMSAYKHPVSGVLHHGKTIIDDTFFIELIADNDGCLPIRAPNGDLDFTCRYGTFFTTIHELNAGLKTGDVKIRKIIRTIDMFQSTDFSEFVNHFYALKTQAKIDGDRVRELFYKFILNSACGKFSQNPEGYRDYTITLHSAFPKDGVYHAKENPNGWRPRYINGGRTIWERQSQSRRPNYFNVGTGASITGAARAELHLGFRLSDRPVYCDTDSIICRGLGARLDERSLGGWKLEASGSRIAIAGKKLYALFDDNGKVVKKASKGANLTGEEILQVAGGEDFLYKHAVPTFSLDGSVEYLERLIQRTGA